jgi:hypothetical protein
MATAASHDTSRVANRWLIAAAGVVMQLALGAVYAWSVFRNPLRDEFGWSQHPPRRHRRARARRRRERVARGDLKLA